MAEVIETVGDGPPDREALMGRDEAPRQLRGVDWRDVRAGHGCGRDRACSVRTPGSREERERVDVPGPHDAEVAVVDRGYLGDPEPFGGGNDRRIDGAEREVPIDGDEFRDA
jgi:hypothetical protein